MKELSLRIPTDSRRRARREPANSVWQIEEEKIIIE